MRLSLCFLLLILAVFCYEANADHVCKAYAHEVLIFVAGKKTTLRKELERYNAPQEAVDAKMEVKKCIDMMDERHRNKITFVLIQLLITCGFQDLQHYFPSIRHHLVVT
ncbi:prostatic steroid-binding protein C1-like [Psammomys obesus]|uniref:prostatic steroid-binding protein C1-like n=1 Tax=Psammomys obesus TaxID=48139 RepID=UPI0024536EBD|nr:prostatic steroid-binding protein C1-like [Psammomys obesus]